MRIGPADGASAGPGQSLITSRRGYGTQGFIDAIVLRQEDASLNAFVMAPPRRPAAKAMPSAIMTISTPYSVPIEPCSSPQKRDKNSPVSFISIAPTCVNRQFASILRNARSEFNLTRGRSRPAWADLRTRVPTSIDRKPSDDRNLPLS